MDIKVLKDIMEVAKKNRKDPDGLCPALFFFQGDQIAHLEPAIFGSHNGL